MLGHRLCFIDDFCRVQQCFGGYTANIETNATEYRIALYQNHLQSKVGSTKGSGVAARSRTDHYELSTVGCIRDRRLRNWCGSCLCKFRLWVDDRRRFDIASFVCSGLNGYYFIAGTHLIAGVYIDTQDDSGVR